jgi:hypothetical protein
MAGTKNRVSSKKKEITMYKVLVKCPADSKIYETELPYKPTVMPRIYCEDHEHYRDISE